MINQVLYIFSDVSAQPALEARPPCFSPDLEVWHSPDHKREAGRTGGGTQQTLSPINLGPIETKGAQQLICSRWGTWAGTQTGHVTSILKYGGCWFRSHLSGDEHKKKSPIKSPASVMNLYIKLFSIDKFSHKNTNTSKTCTCIKSNESTSKSLYVQKQSKDFTRILHINNHSPLFRSFSSTSILLRSASIDFWLSSSFPWMSS